MIDRLPLGRQGWWIDLTPQLGLSGNERTALIGCSSPTPDIGSRWFRLAGPIAHGSVAVERQINRPRELPVSDGFTQRDGRHVALYIDVGDRGRRSRKSSRFAHLSSHSERRVVAIFLRTGFAVDGEQTRKRTGTITLSTAAPSLGSRDGEFGRLAEAWLPRFWPGLESGAYLRIAGASWPTGQ